MLIQLKSQVPLCHGRHRTVLDCLWTRQLDISGIAPLSSLLHYLNSRPALVKAGVVQSYEALPFETRTELRPLTELVSAAAQDLGVLAAENANKLHDQALLMSMRGAQPHLDIPTRRWVDKLFWALSLHDTDTDVLFGNLGHRIPLLAGILLIFDPCQPHAVIAREQFGFKKSHFTKTRVQHCAGGDFLPVDWASMGAKHSLTADEYRARRNVQTALVHQATCAIKKTPWLSKQADTWA